MRNARMSPCQRDFAELVEDRCRRRVDQCVEDWDRQDRSITFRDLSQDGDLGFLEFGKRHDVELLDLVGVRAQGLPRFRPGDDRRHSKARTRRKVVELAENVLGSESKPDLLMGLAECGFHDRFAAIETPAGQGELAGVVSEARRAASDQETRVALFVGRDDEGDGGRAQRGIRLNSSLETR